MSNRTHILLATLGGQPQIITFTLDLLLKRFPITEVIVLHPRATNERLQSALSRLRAEFVGNYYQAADKVIHLRSHILQLDGQPIDDIIDDVHADGTLDTIHQLVGDLKRQGHHIHLSVSGGRRMISLLAISVAALNFDRHDHIWHIYTPEHIVQRAKDEGHMHMPDDAGIKLIKGPFISLGAYIYPHPTSFRIAQEERRAQMEAQDRTCCIHVVNEATPSQRKVLQALAQGLRPQKVAEQLSISLTTVHSHKTALLRLCHNAWNIDDCERLDYHFLQAKFASYFELDE